MIHGDHPPVTQQNLFGADACGAEHPLVTARCDRFGEHHTHEGFHGDSSTRLSWAEAEKGLSVPEGAIELRARATDPSSSHAAAARDFDIPSGAGDLQRAIIELVIAESDRWFSCRELIGLIFGPGPYSYQQAVALNKVQTIALALHRKGWLDRLDRGRGQPVRYSAHPDLEISR